MHVRLSFQNRIFIVLGLMTILTLLVVWIVVRPKYESSVIAERLTILQQVQSYAIENLDRTIASWSTVTRYIAWQASERPKEGEFLLQSMMTLHPEIILIKIQSPKLTDELTSRNTSYPAFTLEHYDTCWIASKMDTTQRIQWIVDTTNKVQYFFIQTRFTVQEIPFVLTTIWDAKRLHALFTSIPIGGEYSASIESRTSVLIKNHSSFITSGAHRAGERTNTLETISQNSSFWRVLTGAFKTADLWLTVAVPEKTIVQPVEDLLLYSTISIVGLACVMLLLGWMLAHQISRPIARLVQDVRKLSNLDFSQPIQIPAMTDLRGMGETIELMRTVLERYQRLNVEKIILEEWKNKLFMTHSDDMIGFTDGAGVFVFRNEKLEEFCSSLLPTRQLNSKSDLLTHPTMVTTKEMIHEDTSGTLGVHFVQSELYVQLGSEVPGYFRLNDLTLTRSEENLGSLLIFHDLTNERLIDKTKTDMINLVVHELRNPVGSIMGFSEILLSDISVTEEERKKFIELILTGSKNLNNLINRFLDVSRLESRRIEYPKSPADIAAIVKGVIEIQKPQLLNKLLTVELETSDGIPEVVVSPDLYREAVLNLLSNAIKYGGPERTILVSLAFQRGSIILTMIDHGYGIPADKQEKLFTKFYRVYNPNTTKEIGTGLGLAYVKEIASYHNGSIALESDAAFGCKFTMTIPAVLSPSQPEQPVEG